jgi:hypothetical protein
MDRIRTWSSALSQTEVTSLYRQDIDRDGLWDITESGTRYSDYQSALPYHPAPNDPNAPQPTQTGYARSPYLYSSTLDFDQDELHDLAEQAAGTRLTEPDTDGDNLTDGFEVAYTFNPLNAFSLGLTSPRDDLSDPDSDSLSTLTEYFNGSNPRNPNTDGDATDDTTEVAQGSDLANAADSGAAPTDPPYQVPFHINGDYTAWEATLKGKGPNDTRTRRFRMSAHNIPLDETFELLRGNAYELTLRYIRSKPGESVPWYCWEASINGDTSPIFIAGGEWIVDNRSGLLAEHTHSHGTNLIEKKKVDLLPVDIVSRDKFLAGSFSIPSDWDSLEMEFVGPDGSLGKYGNLLGGGNTKIYDKVEDIMADPDYAAGGQVATQKVWFVRDSTDARKINYYTCFDSTGEVKIKLYLNGKPESLGEITHTLTAAPDFAAVIDYVDQWVKGTSFDFTGGVITPPLAMRSASAQSSVSEGIHNLTRAALIPFFNVVNNVEGLGSVAFGLFDGIKEGVSDDYKLLVLIKSGVLGAGGWAIQAAEAELNKWKDDPLKRAAELKKAADRLCQEWVFKPMEQVQADLSTWEGFKKRSWQTWNSVKGTTNKVWVLTKDSWGSIKTGLSDWVNDFADRMMEGAEKAHWSENLLVMDKIGGDLNEVTRQASYTFGYTFGYISEQVAVGILTGGTVKVAAVMTKGGAAMATQLAARRVLPVVARLQFVKKWAASLAISIEMKVAVERGLIIAAESPLSLAVKDSAAEVIERGMTRATFERIAFSNSKVLDEVIAALSIKKLILTPGREGQFWYKFALFFEGMGDKATAPASKGWVKAYNKLLKFNGDILEDDRAGDFFTLLRMESSATGREITGKSLAEYSVNGGEKLWIRDLHTLQPKGYRYVTQYDLDQIAANGGKLPLHPTRDGQYFTLNGNYATGQAAKDKLQLPRPASEYIGRVEFDLSPVKDKI